MLKQIVTYAIKSILYCFLIFVLLTYAYAFVTYLMEERIEPVASRAGKPVQAAKGGPESPDSVILFGDLHVHTTLSVDAFMWNLPAVGGMGVRPLAEACNFARHCSGIDFFSSTDHAESLTLEDWNEVKEDIRLCNAAAGEPEDPDLIAFSGFEWTQITNDAKEYYGHKNVIFKHIGEDRLPARPISSWIFPTGGFLPKTLYLMPLGDPLNPLPYIRYADLLGRLAGREDCPAETDTRELSPGCRELARTASHLFLKLDQWGLDALVIPHGTAWGLHVPPDADYISQLPEHDPKYQRLIEIYSGHGNSEPYKEWKPIEIDENGNKICPEPTEDYLPCCWRAGEIVKARCVGSEEDCEKQAQKARNDYANAGYSGFKAIDAEPEDFLDCGLCRDCYKPPLDLVPGASVQRILAASIRRDGGNKKEFKMGFIGSTDTHRSKAGHGYVERVSQTDAWQERTPFYAFLPKLFTKGSGQNFERNTSYFYTGGLAAVHAKAKTREAIWEALVNKNTYGTSGQRLLLWFDLINSTEGKMPMGSEVTQKHNPIFKIKAAGSPKLLPGCPEFTVAQMGTGFIEDVCDGQCYNPSSERYRIVRIEVIKIQQQQTMNENLSLLIQDPYKVFACPMDLEVCEATFTDLEYAHENRSAAYYVRAVQEETDAVNGNTVNCEYDENGKCIKINPCNPNTSDCLGRAEERAWSSPIYLSPGE